MGVLRAFLAAFATWIRRFQTPVGNG